MRFMNVNLYDRPRLKNWYGASISFSAAIASSISTKKPRPKSCQIFETHCVRRYLMIGFSETLHDTSGLFKTIHAGRSVIREKQ